MSQVLQIFNLDLKCDYIWSRFVTLYFLDMSIVIFNFIFYKNVIVIYLLCVQQDETRWQVAASPQSSLAKTPLTDTLLAQTSAVLVLLLLLLQLAPCVHREAIYWCYTGRRQKVLGSSHFSVMLWAPLIKHCWWCW